MFLRVGLLRGGPSEGWVKGGFAHKCMLLAPRKLANTAAVMLIRNEASVCVCMHAHEYVHVCVRMRDTCVHAYAICTTF